MKLYNAEGTLILEASTITYNYELRVWETPVAVVQDPEHLFYIQEQHIPTTKVSPIQFKLLFTPQERVAIKAIRATDPVIDDFFDIIEDLRLTHVDLSLFSTQSALTYLESLTLLAPGRKEQILAGVYQ